MTVAVSPNPHQNFDDVGAEVCEDGDGVGADEVMPGNDDRWHTLERRGNGERGVGRLRCKEREN